MFKTSFLAVLFCLAGLLACDEIDSVVSDDPKIYLFLLNRDSLDQVEPILEELSLELVGLDTTLSNLEIEESYWFIQLEQYTDSVEVQGLTDLEDERAEADSIWEVLSANLVTLEYEDSVLNAENDIWTSAQSTIESGYVNISQIRNLQLSDASIDYESSDSLALWSLPLDMNSNQSGFEITIDNETFELNVSYDLETLVDENSRVVRQASNLDILSSTFDFDSLNCEDCLDYNTTIYVEF